MSGADDSEIATLPVSMPHSSSLVSRVRVKFSEDSDKASCSIFWSASASLLWILGQQL